jgi:DNA N-6-adenine-methyltransferase Dam
MSDLPAIPTLRDLVRSEDPEIVVNTREDLIGYAEAARARRDAIAMLEGLRAARVTEWEMAHRWPANPNGAHRTDDRPPLSVDRGDSNDAWQRVYAVGRVDVEDILARDRIEDLVQRAFRTKDAHVGSNTGMPEWYTPAELIDAARDVLGGIDLDPASSDIANETVKADRYYTVDVNGLTQPWQGRVWMNPPYTAGLVGLFATKLLDEHHAGNVPAALALTNNSTDTRWWQSLARRSRGVCMLAGRVRFYDEDGNPGTPLQGQTVCYLGDDPAVFIERFDTFGVVL